MNRSREVLYKQQGLRAGLLGALFMCSFFASGQNFHEAIGMRISNGIGVSYKRMLQPGKAIEGIAAVRWGGVVFTGLYAKHKTMGESGHWTWYYGGGAHLGYHSRENVLNPTPEQRRDLYVNVGIDGIVGIDYTLQNIPVHISLDYKPSWDFNANRFFVGEGLGLSLRYILKR